MPYFLPITVYESAILLYSKVTEHYSLTMHLPIGQVDWHTGILSLPPPTLILQISYRDAGHYINQIYLGLKIKTIVENAIVCSTYFSYWNIHHTYPIHSWDPSAWHLSPFRKVRILYFGINGRQPISHRSWKKWHQLLSGTRPKFWVLANTVSRFACAFPFSRIASRLTNIISRSWFQHG